MDAAVVVALRSDLLAQGWDEDIAQEVVCLMLEKGVVGEPADLRKWAFATARRLRLKEWRRARRSSHLPQQWEGGGAEAGEDAESALEGGAVPEAIKTPADQLRRLVALEDIEQAPPSLVGEVLGGKVLTRQNRQQRRKVLRKRLEVAK